MTSFTFTYYCPRTSDKYHVEVTEGEFSHALRFVDGRGQPLGYTTMTSLTPDVRAALEQKIAERLASK